MAEKRTLGDIIQHGYFMRDDRLAGPDDGRYDINNIIEMFSKGIELPKGMSEEDRGDVSSIQEIFERDTPKTEEIFELSEGFTLSPLTLLRRYLAKKELEKKGLANGGMTNMLGTGGITGNKTYHQYHDQFVPRDSESMGYAHGGGVGSMMKAKRGLVNEPGGYAGYYGGGADYIGLNPNNAPIKVKNLQRTKDGEFIDAEQFLVSAANPLKNQDYTIPAHPNVMEVPGVTTIEGALINDDYYPKDKIRSMVTTPERFSNTVAPVPNKAPWEGYRDRIRDMGIPGYENMNALEKDIANVAYNTSQEEFDAGDDGTYEDTQKYFRLKGEPIKAENWSPKDIFDMNTTLGGYKKWPKGDQWNNKDKYLKSEEYLQSLEPSLSGINTDKKGFNFSNLFPGKAIYEGLAGLLPDMDPRQVALRDFYGYDDIGRVPQGELMAGYNPVSGGFLHTLTGGKFGDPTNYGLQRSYDKRINTINKTLAKWEADEEKYADKLKNTSLYARKKALEEAKAAELAVLNKVKADQAALALKEKQKEDRKTGGEGYKSVGHYGKKPGTTGSWTPGGSYKSSSPKGYSSRSHSGGDYGGRHHWADGGLISLKR
jgi:hypothetical protein